MQFYASMIDWHEYKFVGFVGLCQYACVVLHSALVDAVINPHIIPPGSPYCLKLTAREYTKEFPNLFSFYLTLHRTFASTKGCDPQPSIELVAKSTIQTSIAWVVLATMFLFLAVLLFAFDISLPSVSVNVEVGGTRIVLQATKLRLSSLQLSLDSLLTPLRVFHILFRCNLSACVDGVSLECTSVEGNIETGFSTLWHFFVQPHTTLYSLSTLPKAQYYNFQTQSRKGQTFVEAWARAVTIRVDKVALAIDLYGIPASLYLIVKDVLTDHCGKNSNNIALSAKLAASEDCDRSSNSITKQSVRVPAILLCIRKVRISIKDIMPSVTHTVRVDNLQYQRIRASAINVASSTDVEPMEHLLRVASCDVYSARSGRVHNNSGGNTRYGQGRVPGRPKKNMQGNRELQCSLRQIEAKLTAVRSPSAKPQIHHTSVNIASMYLLPIVIPTNVSKETTMGCISMDKNEDVDSAKCDCLAKDELAVIAYKEFVSVFLC